jgi:4-amino-4-deoxy-L-arabinose transferase-like glycosyltransferase
MSKRGKKRERMNQPAAPKVPVSEPDAAPSDFPGGLKVELLALFLILAAFAALGFNSFRQESVTIDEVAFLPAGFYNLKTRDFRLYPYHPPLIRILAAIPLLKSPARIPPEKNQNRVDIWQMGKDFMDENNRHYQSIFVKARVVILILGMMLVALSWWWARSLYGPQSGILAATLTAFCPNIMAHSGLVTTDLGASLAFLASIYGFWKFCQKPGLSRGAGMGFLLGIALACKFTSLILIPIMIALSVVYFWRDRKALNWKAIGKGITLAIISSWLVLNTAYFWKGTATRVSGYKFVSPMFSQKLTKILPPGLPIPLPYDYVRGFDFMSFQNEAGGWSYLLGELSRKGWKYYFLVALAVKMTLASLALILGAIYSLTFFRKSWRDELFLILPALAVIGVISLTVSLGFGFRYILPAIPFLYIFAARLASPLLNLKIRLKAAIWLLLLAHIISNLLIYPHYLAYFNLAAGGPEKGYKILADSNIDWGQDLIRLKKYMDEQKLDELCLVHFGRVDPQIYGISYQLPYPGVDCRLLAISVNFLVGLPYFANDHGKIVGVKPENFRGLRARKPLARVGYSILVFDLAQDPSLKEGRAGLPR